ncbi:MAG: excinuclease ABC subunit UvrA, partial [Spirochaetia bacterium]|nr:excinuclease ABC subunit UvrA [Spirochaetia bacterium]
DKELHISYTSQRGDKTSEYNRAFPGIFRDLERRHREAFSDSIKEWVESFMSQNECTACHGSRLRPESMAVTVGGLNINQLTSLSVGELVEFFRKLELSETEKQICFQIMKEINARLSFLSSVGLNYLTLDRKASTLSGGEAQRIRLATQIGSSLVGVLYILDEPTIGLHQRDNQKLIDTLKHLRDIGNTLIVVEHDEQTIRAADYVVELGPGAGVHGGNIVAQGTVPELLKNPASITARFLNGQERVEHTFIERVKNDGWITIMGASEHNLKNIDVKIPLGKLVVVTGVSGSGKSTLVNDILYPAVFNKMNKTSRPVGAHRCITGLENIDKIINIDQSAIGRTPRSNPATYVEVFSQLRQIFAELPESKAKGYKPGRFSFNIKGGRCESCQGGGEIKIEMHFLPDVYITCDVCGGKRFNRDTLEVRYKGKNIYEVLEMTVEEACSFFKNIPAISRKLEALKDVGLGYIKLGQSALTLSGGEAQRVKLAYELSKVSTGRTLYILDEPTTGLHFADVKQLMEVVERIVSKGNSVVIIEHNMDVIRMADYIIDLGPEGGTGGGTVVAVGTPEEIAGCSRSYTGQFLREVL